jgi:hypothetical protein
MPRTFNDYGPAAQRFLLRAFSEGVALDDPLATAVVRDGESRAIRLERAGLVHQRQSKKGRVSWRCTDVGRGLVMEHRPVFLHRRGFPSYTLKSWQAMHGEGEVMEAA